MSIIVATHVRDYVFVALRERRPAIAKKMRLVSEDFYEKMESRLRMHIIANVRAADGGDLKTLRAPAGVVRPEGTPWIVNQTYLHDFIKAVIGQTATKLELISAEYIEYCDAFLRRAICAHIDTIPSAGQTVR